MFRSLIKPINTTYNIHQWKVLFSRMYVLCWCFVFSKAKTQVGVDYIITSADKASGVSTEKRVILKTTQRIILIDCSNCKNVFFFNIF